MHKHFIINTVIKSKIKTGPQMGKNPKKDCTLMDSYTLYPTCFIIDHHSFENKSETLTDATESRFCTTEIH